MLRLTSPFRLLTLGQVHHNLDSVPNRYVGVLMLRWGFDAAFDVTVYLLCSEFAEDGSSETHEYNVPGSEGLPYDDAGSSPFEHEEEAYAAQVQRDSSWPRVIVEFCNSRMCCRARAPVTRG